MDMITPEQWIIDYKQDRLASPRLLSFNSGDFIRAIQNDARADLIPVHSQDCRCVDCYIRDHRQR